jgi:hypothetical protein
MQHRDDTESPGCKYAAWMTVVIVLSILTVDYLSVRHIHYVETRVHQHLKQAENPLFCANHVEEWSRETCKVNLALPFDQNQLAIKTQKAELEKTIALLAERMEYHEKNMDVNPVMYHEITWSLHKTLDILKTAMDRMVDYEGLDQTVKSQLRYLESRLTEMEAFSKHLQS